MSSVRAHLVDEGLQSNEPKLDIKFRQLRELQAETKEIFAQFQAETIKCQSAQYALELLQKQQHNLREEIDRCTARKLASIGRRNAVRKSMEWICNEIPNAESSPVRPRRFPLFGSQLYLQTTNSTYRRQNQALVAEICHLTDKRSETACNLSLENAQDRLRTLFDQVLSKTKSDSEVALQALTQQLNDEREAFTAQYLNEVNSTADKRLEMYDHGLRLKLISIEGDVSRLQNQVGLVNHGIEVIRAQSDLIAREGGARCEYLLADIKLLGEQLEMASQGGRQFGTNSVFDADEMKGRIMAAAVSRCGE
ncbi:hypothetical protein C8F04DRAFT_1179528 [Mycena alexandri]|uniref:Uncharacterized protein n=1 Tax=Mycena alexandri TaxID=1745969 RepID=A0AAD6T2J0_9AGAR|nr:hypothetical protein C8F04DRAFT_1179528 [Mycena alexandri]